MTERACSEHEWLEADGLGGFASGTATGVRTRRYHGLLTVATTPPTGRMMLVNGAEVWATTSTGRVALSTHRYAPGVDHPDGYSRLERFTATPWPMWTWDLGEGRILTLEVVSHHGRPRTICVWTLDGTGPVTLEIRPLLSGRDYHALHHENVSYRHDTTVEGARLTWQPYADVPAVHCLTTGEFCSDAQWFRQFQYEQERLRGLDALEDLASPGVITCALRDGPAVCVFETAHADEQMATARRDVRAMALTWLAAERRRRRRLGDALHRAADAYLVARGGGKTIVAGYPWFTDWGRDTFIALRGLCLATGRFVDARDILLEWAGAVDQGMLPNRFADTGDAPEFNAVDASLWFVVAAGELISSAPRCLTRAGRARLQAAMQAILQGYAAGTRYDIGMTSDGLLQAGTAGQQLTWMDARSGGREVTPRIGKPVEVQALWVNALYAGASFDPAWRPLADRARVVAAERYWNAERRMLFDVVDVDHEPGRVDDACRPNQVFAVGGLPVPLLDGARAAAVVDAVERLLWTPLGLRTLAAGEPGYHGRYRGGADERDAAYHQGSVWPWLLDAFVDAWLRRHGETDAAHAVADARFVAPLQAHLAAAGIGHVSELADGDAPDHPQGCPFQAWSLAALLRMKQRILRNESARLVAV